MAWGWVSQPPGSLWHIGWCSSRQGSRSISRSHLVQLDFYHHQLGMYGVSYCYNHHKFGHLYTYTYIHTYIYIYIHITYLISNYISIIAYTCIHLYISNYIGIFAYTCMHIYISNYIDIFSYTCIDIYMYTHICIYKNIYIQKQIHI